MKLLGVLLLLFLFVGLALACVLTQPMELATEIPVELLAPEAPPVAVAQMPIEAWHLNDLASYAARSRDHFDHSRQWYITPAKDQINTGRRAACVLNADVNRSTDLDRFPMHAHQLFWCNCNRSHEIQSGRFSGAAA